MKKILDEIPFSKDYNYDKLTDEETAELVKRLSLTKKGSKAYLAKAITKTVLQIVMLCVLISVSYSLLIGAIVQTICFIS